MANPIVIEITPENKWIKIATAVTQGSVCIKTNEPVAYFFDNRETGEAAPAGLSTAKRFDKTGNEIILNSIPIDVYIYALHVPGNIILDL